MSANEKLNMGREVEQAVVGMMLISSDVADDAIARLNEAHFQFGEEKLIFRAVSDLLARGQLADPVTVTEWVRVRAKKNLTEYVGALVGAAPEPDAAGDYFGILRSRAMERRLQSFGGHLSSVLDSALTPEEKIAALKDELEQVSEASTEGGAVALRTVFHNVMEQISRSVSGEETGIKTGFDELDEMTGGLQPGDLIIVAGRPSMGKTAFSMNIAENVALNKKHKVSVFSMEMPDTQLGMRIISGRGEVNLRSMRSGTLSDDDLGNIEQVIDMFDDESILIDDEGGLSIQELRNRARKIKRDHPELALIIVDYLQLMTTNNKNARNRTEEISDISRGLKSLAKELGVAVVALSQLSRGCESRADKRPMCSDLRESGAIEQDADVIMFVYRDEVYNPQSRFKGLSEIIIGKQRNGPIGTVELAFDNRFSRFRNKTPGESPFNDSYPSPDDQINGLEL